MAFSKRIHVVSHYKTAIQYFFKRCFIPKICVYKVPCCWQVLLKCKTTSCEVMQIVSNTLQLYKKQGEFAVVLQGVEWIYCQIILSHHLHHFRSGPQKYSKAPWWIPNPWPCCSNLQHEPPDSSFEIQWLRFSSDFVTTKCWITAEIVVNWEWSLKYRYLKCCLQSPIFPW